MTPDQFTQLAKMGFPHTARDWSADDLAREYARWQTRRRRIMAALVFLAAVCVGVGL